MAKQLDQHLDRLVDVLVENATVVLSGTKLASQLRVPHSTLWELIERLREMGAEIRGLPGTGYQLVKAPDVLTPRMIRRSLPAGEFGGRIHHHYQVDSTMSEAARLASANAPHGTLVVAEEQTAGRGRFGRTWFSPRGTGLYFTVILRPKLSPAAAPILTLLAGISVAEAVSELASLPIDIRRPDMRWPDIRWPNDVLIGGKKCAGILVEMTAQPERVEHAQIGIGVNVNQAEIPAELAAEATSLRIEAGRGFSRLEVLVSILKRLEHYYHRLEERGAGAIVGRFGEISSYARGKRVRVTDGQRVIIGETVGLSPEGMLLVRRDDGEVEAVLSGLVRPES
ncbi:MAG: biotin--[acetyl-CoA-carboxylase] ligase [Acidobacteria bacterium RIFCSPLOWO2_12_FULL_60_22]|nr:MAG: biotin--[acetyl-CoA-carboxylase] ligase [Acidobacteria bacterium RIFCSPLOWO2_12_FULL_60_22]